MIRRSEFTIKVGGNHQNPGLAVCTTPVLVLKKKRFKKKLRKIKFWSTKSNTPSKIDGFCRQKLEFVEKTCFFREKRESTFFLKWIFDQKKWKIFDRIFFYELIQTSENRLAVVSERTTPGIKIKKKVAEKVREIPNRKLTGLLRPRDMAIPVWRQKPIGFWRFLDDSVSRVITLQIDISWRS